MPAPKWPGPTPEQQALLDQLAAQERLLIEAKRAADRVFQGKIALMQEAMAAGIPSQALADTLVVTPGRISQILKRPQAEEPDAIFGVPEPEQWAVPNR